MINYICFKCGKTKASSIKFVFMQEGWLCMTCLKSEIRGKTVDPPYNKINEVKK